MISRASIPAPGLSHRKSKMLTILNTYSTDQWYQSDEQFLKDMQPLIDSTPAAARVGEVDDIAPLVAFLCSDDARWTTGSVLSANGGLYN